MNTESNSHSDSPQDRFVQSVLGMGAEWAAFGLQVGTQALERSAKSLELAAKALSTLSRSIEERAAAHEKVVDTQGEAVVEQDSQDPARL